jgi:hypothetical protein
MVLAAGCIWLTLRIVNRQKNWSKRTKWTLSVLVILPTLYVLSSGPMRTVAIHRQGIYSIDGALITEAIGIENSAYQWSMFYAPLTWASQIEQGKPLNWYWDLFPIRDGHPLLGRRNGRQIVLISAGRDKNVTGNDRSASVVNPPSPNPDVGP